jgi:hypothetical protein
VPNVVIPDERERSERDDPGPIGQNIVERGPVLVLMPSLAPTRNPAAPTQWVPARRGPSLRFGPLGRDDGIALSSPHPSVYSCRSGLISSMTLISRRERFMPERRSEPAVQDERFAHPPTSPRAGKVLHRLCFF